MRSNQNSDITTTLKISGWKEKIFFSFLEIVCSHPMRTHQRQQKQDYKLNKCTEQMTKCQEISNCLTRPVLYRGGANERKDNDHGAVWCFSRLRDPNLPPIALLITVSLLIYFKTKFIKKRQDMVITPSNYGRPIGWFEKKKKKYSMPRTSDRERTIQLESIFF